MKMSFNYYATAPAFVETRNEAFVLALMEALKEAKMGCRVTGVQFAQPDVAECATIWVDAPATQDVPYDGMLEFVSFHFKETMSVWRYVGNGVFQFYQTRKGPYFDGPIVYEA